MPGTIVRILHIPINPHHPHELGLLSPFTGEINSFRED